MDKYRTMESSTGFSFLVWENGGGDNPTSVVNFGNYRFGAVIPVLKTNNTWRREGCQHVDTQLLLSQNNGSPLTLERSIEVGGSPGSQMEHFSTELSLISLLVFFNS